MALAGCSGHENGKDSVVLSIDDSRNEISRYVIQSEIDSPHYEMEARKIAVLGEDAEMIDMSSMSVRDNLLIRGRGGVYYYAPFGSATPGGL